MDHAGDSGGGAGDGRLSRAAAKRTTGVMPDGHGLAGWAGGSRLERGRGRPWQGANRRLADPTLALADPFAAR